MSFPLTPLICLDDDKNVKSITFWVESKYGGPAPKGSFIVVKKGGGRVRNANRKTEPWQTCVNLTAREHVRDLSGLPFDCPVELNLKFYLEKKKTRRDKQPYYQVKPDLDKLVRTIFDALQGVLVVEDSRICKLTCSKVYTDKDCPPGVHIDVARL